MPAQTKPVSDSPAASDSITGFTIGGSGNVGFPVSDSVTLTENIANSNAKVTVAIDTTFGHLNGQNIRRASVRNTTNLEKLAVVNLTFGSDIVYKTNGVVVDFSSIARTQRFGTVYFCHTSHKSTAMYVLFVPDTNNSPSLGKMKFFDSTGTELPDGSILIQGVTMKCIIRGS